LSASTSSSSVAAPATTEEQFNANSKNNNTYSNSFAFAGGMFAMAGMGGMVYAASTLTGAGKKTTTSSKAKGKSIAGGKLNKALLGGKGKNTNAPRKADWLPGTYAPEHLDGTLAGDRGFDPFGFGKADLSKMRDAELKHSRIAMLAAAGWPLSELWNKQIADIYFGGNSILVDGDRAPSLLNGVKPDDVNDEYILGAAAFAALIGSYFELTDKKVDPNNPGDKDWDPLKLKEFRSNLKLSDKENASFDMELAEIKHGRLAMLAIVSFALEEFITKVGVVDETPQFF